MIPDADSGADAVAIALGAAQAQNEPVARLRADVFPELGGRAQRGHHRIDAAVAIEIGERGAAMRLHQREARFGGDVLKYASRVGEHAVGFLVHRRLEHLDPVVHVRVGGEQVLPAVVVEIEQAELPSRCAARSADPGGILVWRR